MHSFYIVDKRDFFHEYYGLVISVHKIASHKLAPKAQDIKGMETTCASSINMVGTIVKKWYWTPKAGLNKIMLVCYHMTMTGLLGYVSDLSTPFSYGVRKESSIMITVDCSTIPGGSKNLFNLL